MAQSPRKPLRVLVADDNAVNRKLYSTLLQRKGHEVITADNGQAALRAMHATPVDLVLMDVEMPELDGCEATSRFRADEPPGSHLWIVALTAHYDEQKKLLGCGMDAVMVKPVRPADLDAMVDRLFPLRREPFDREDALRRLDGEDTLLRELLSVFAEDYPTTLGEIRSAVRRGDRSAMVFAAHKLAGTLGSISAGPAQDAARRVEAAGKQNPEGAGEALQRLEASIDELMSVLKESHLVD
jgi:two-component system, sensor histidine kinase and response regulator